MLELELKKIRKEISLLRKSNKKLIKAIKHFTDNPITIKSAPGKPTIRKVPTTKTTMYNYLTKVYELLPQQYHDNIKSEIISLGFDNVNQITSDKYQELYDNIEKMIISLKG